MGRDADAQIRRQLASEARYFSGVMQKKLEQLDICYRYPKSSRDFGTSGIQKVRFRRAVTTSEALYFELDTLRLPRGISLSHINESAVLTDLAVACGRPVRFRQAVDTGAWLVVERASGVWGVPRLLPFADTEQNFPDKSEKPLMFPLGVGENKRLIYRSLADMPHMLVGGATDSGKTTFMHAMACTLISHNGPEKLRLAFIDLKGGVEADFYKRIPHLLEVEDALVIDKSGVVQLLERLLATVEQRLTHFREAEVQNINGWNYQHRGDKYMARVVLFVDELANVMLDPELSKRSKNLLADITARGRAAGVHVVLGTQRPEVAVVPGLVKANLDGRVAFRCTDNASSMVLLDDGSAARFDDTTPRGRYIFKRGLDRIEIQGPLITAAQIREIVAAVCAEQAPRVCRATPEEIFRVAVQELGGEFSRRKLYDRLKNQGVSLSYLQKLGSDYENKIIDVEGISYCLLPGDGGKRSRMLVPVTG